MDLVEDEAVAEVALVAMTEAAAAVEAVVAEAVAATIVVTATKIISLSCALLPTTGSLTGYHFAT